MLRLSFTKVQLYNYCPWAYQLRYVQKVTPRFRPRLLLGANVHGVIGEFLGRVRDGLSTGWAEMEAILGARWAEAAPLDGEENERLRREGRVLVRGFWETNKGDFGRPLLLEERFLLPVGAVTLEGIVDRVEDVGGGKVEVIDYKSGSAPKDNSAADSLQLRIYALACTDAWSLDPERVSFYYLQDNSKASAPVNRDALADVRREIVATGEAIAGAIFPPRPGVHCLDCDYLRACEFGRVWVVEHGVGS